MCTNEVSLTSVKAMSKKQLFHDSDSEDELKTNNDYAKSYDKWRQKEELNKLKTKYASVSDYSDSSSDDNEEDLTDVVEKDFLKTLSYLKSKDPRIYDQNVKFFNDTNEDTKRTRKNKKNKPVFINDYDRNFVIKNANIDSDGGDNNVENNSCTYTKEQEMLKENFQAALKALDESEDDEMMFKFRDKNSTTTTENLYETWLSGEKNELEDKQAEKELQPLKQFWTDPNLDEGEKFLRDYILDKKFINKDDGDNDGLESEEEHFSDDETLLEKQDTFEQKYNFRFEEPDDEFIKRYPRTLQDSVRRADDKRKVKRAEIKERKNQEKTKKMEELKQLQFLKKKEIEEKIKKIQEVTGNNEIDFKEEDIDSDFDPEVHDKRMQSLFNDDYYQGREEVQKPEFPDLDEELEIENWDRWHGEENAEEQETEPEQNCEDEAFNMDCDYDPSSVNTQQELIENSRKKNKRKKRKSKFAQIISKSKPIFNPNNKTFQQYLDEYYKFDCEDVIGDIPCKFKYREVLPNNFGLSVEEILLAKDKELNRWCSLKKAVQYRPDHVEKYDVLAYGKKSNNEELKKKLLPSLFVNETEKSKVNLNKNCEQESVIKKPRKKSNVTKLDSEKMSSFETGNKKVLESEEHSQNAKRKRKSKHNSTEGSQNAKKQKKDNKLPHVKKIKFNKKKPNKIQDTNKKQDITNARLSAYGISKKKFKKLNKVKRRN